MRCDVMQVLTLVLGQDFPEVNANAVNQAFSLLAAALGLVSFALVLALVEQIVLEVVENNVRTGSAIFEKDHVSPCSPGNPMPGKLCVLKGLQSLRGISSVPAQHMRAFIASNSFSLQVQFPNEYQVDVSAASRRCRAYWTGICPV